MDGLLTDQSLYSMEMGKGLGKGVGGKGLLMLKGKGKGHHQPEQPKSEESLLDDALQKARKMRDMCNNTLSNLEESVQAVKKSKFWSKAAQEDAQQLMADLQNEVGTLKKALLKKTVSLEEVKEIVQAALKFKECQHSVKEFRQLANKTGSVAASSSSKRNKNA